MKQNSIKHALLILPQKSLNEKQPISLTPVSLSCLDGIYVVHYSAELERTAIKLSAIFKLAVAKISVTTIMKNCVTNVHFMGWEEN